MRTRAQIVMMILFVLQVASFAQEHAPTYIAETDTLVRDKLRRWADGKFGLLMHWGPYSQWGVVESWSICSEDEEWERRRDSDYTEYKRKYENLMKTFRPVRFDPGKWARAAKDAGMRYVVFTTKHHDGFCMFDTQTTDYKITGADCPFGADSRANVTQHIFDAFRREGFMTGAYFSKADWHSPEYWWPNFATPDRNPNYNIQAYPDRWRRFVRFTQTQIDELMSGYGRIDILWLDAGWVRRKTSEEVTAEKVAARYPVFPQSQDIDMPLIVANARKKQPGLIVVDRAVPGPYQNYLTPENTVPDSALPYPWETCMPMATSWSFVPGDRYKPVGTLIHLLVDIVSKGGNFLLNIGPGPDGEWDPAAYERLAGIGEWMRVNSEAIYETRPVSPYKEGNLRLTQLKDGTTFVIYLAGEGERIPPARIRISSLAPASDARITLLGHGKPLEWIKGEDGCEVNVPPDFRDHPPCEHAWVLRISRIEHP